MLVERYPWCGIPSDFRFYVFWRIMWMVFVVFHFCTEIISITYISSWCSDVQSYSGSSRHPFFPGSWQILEFSIYQLSFDLTFSRNSIPPSKWNSGFLEWKPYVSMCQPCSFVDAVLESSESRLGIVLGLEVIVTPGLSTPFNSAGFWKKLCLSWGRVFFH